MSLITSKSDLYRRVRARREPSDAHTLIRSDASLDGDTSRSIHDSSLELSDEGSQAELDDIQQATGDPMSVSFGALAKVQSKMKQKRIKGGKAGSGSIPGSGWINTEELERKAGRKDHRDFHRSSKHAPTEVSSKKAVSRRREVIPMKERRYRDPRFEPATGPVDQTKVNAAYSFLNEYRDSEMKELKYAIRSEKDEVSREKLSRTLLSMESKKKAQLRKDREQEVLERHRKQEKTLVRSGKQPYYLKKSEQKRRLLLDQYSGLKGRQLDHVMERRRKKQEGKEKRRLPLVRRTADTPT